MEVNRDVTRRDILYGVLKRMDEVIDSISNTVRCVISFTTWTGWRRPNWPLWRCWKTCSRKRERIKETLINPAGTQTH